MKVNFKKVNLMVNYYFVNLVFIIGVELNIDFLVFKWFIMVFWVILKIVDIVNERGRRGLN